MKLHPLEWCAELIPPVLLHCLHMMLPARRGAALAVFGWLLCLCIPACSAVPARTLTLDQLLLAQQATTFDTPVAATISLTSRVAPLFAHGHGYGQSGWDAGNCPVLLTKDEACSVIIEEARAAGLHFTPNAATLYNILPVQGRPANVSLPAPKRSLTLDGVDIEQKIAFVFVSTAEANSWRKPCGHGALGEGVDIFGCATSLRDVLAGAPLNGYFAVFYDPTVAIADLPEASANDQDQQAAGDLGSAARAYAREQLRRQVRDFIGWLKARNG